MENERWLVQSLDDLQVVADHMVKLRQKFAIFGLSGPLGAGKTTLSQKFLQACGVNEAITSPTFTYVNIYQNNNGECFYHFDLYRLSSITSFFEAGFDEYLYRPQSWCLIEWPELIKPLLTKQVCYITLDYNENNRIIAFEKIA